MVEVSAPSRCDALHRGKNLRICRDTIGGPETWNYDARDCYSSMVSRVVDFAVRAGCWATPQRHDSSHTAMMMMISSCPLHVPTSYHPLDLTYAAGGCPASRQVRLFDSRLGQRMTILTDLHAADADHPNNDQDAVPRTFPSKCPYRCKRHLRLHRAVITSGFRRFQLTIL